MPRFWSLTLIFFAFAVGTPFAHAQLTATDPLTLDLNPLYPAPFQYVTVTPQSTQFDLSASTITIKVNGQQAWQGSGQQPVNVQMGAAGTKTTILVTAVNAGKTYTKQVTLRPSSVALIEEPLSTTHLFYEGASLVAPDGQIRLVAIPDLRNESGARLDPSTLTYTWKLGDQVLQAQSGIGHNVLTASAPLQYRDAQVTVLVTNADSSLVAQSSIDISTNEPVVHIYRNDPLLGPLFNIALSGSYAMSGQEDTFRAVPYFFATKPSIAWTVNGKNSDTDKDITVRATGSGSGTASLSVLATPLSGFQTATAMLSVAFGNKGSLGIFGL